jgi:meso-butanediol dehydrogenase / (S,S)-butanediol dehydrogenase / diacetyl reductase
MTIPAAAGTSRFVGKVALVTGAGSGIGRAVAQRLAAEGARVACLDINGHEATADGLGSSCTAVRCDVSDYAEVEMAVASAASQLGPIDVACNIAGIGSFAHSHEETPERFAKIVSVNLNGTFHVCRAVLPSMLERASGVIVNTASNAGLMGQAWSAAYCASKGGVVNMTRALAYEYRDKGVRVNAVAPGGTMTNIVNSFGLPEGADFKLLHKVMSPMKIAEPEEIAGLFAFIASQEGRYMTGSIVSMDGGLVL